MTRGITRRAFLKLAVALVTYVGLPPERLIAATSGDGELDTEAEILVGRAQYSLAVRSAPSFGSPVLRWLHPDTSVNLLGAVMGDRPNSYNNVWYLIPGGFVHSAWVQPMTHYGPQPVEHDVPEWGFWGEVCRPPAGAIAREAPHNAAKEDYRLYYGTVHHVISVVDDPGRFRRAHQLQAYLGLVPSENTSGKRKLGAITKQGNGYLRSLLVQAAWSVMRQRRSDPLKAWGQALAKRGGKRVAAVAVARRLAGILFAMWRDMSAYDREALAGKSARGKRSEAVRTDSTAARIAKTA